jgi:hypothetical protein
MYGGRVGDEEEMSNSDAADDMEVDQVENSSDEEPEPSTRKRGIGRLQVRISPIFVEFVAERCEVVTVIQYNPHKRSPYEGRILLSDVFGRRRPVGFVRESYPVRGGTLWVTCQLRDRPPPLIGGYAVFIIMFILCNISSYMPTILVE